MKNLAEKALLVTLNISQWSARKYDRKVTEEVNDTHQAKDAGRFNKLLIDKTHLDEIQKIVNEARHFHATKPHSRRVWIRSVRSMTA